MRISFDLDDTLICHRPDVPAEPALPWYMRLFAGNEPLRLGTKQLFRSLLQQGWSIWIYTTSYRSARGIRTWLWCHGLHVDGIINQSIHNAALAKANCPHRPSKNPALFDIQLHVDDLDGVQLEGIRHGFQVICILATDAHWVEKVLEVAEGYMTLGGRQM